jgi:acetyl esterase/lipase
MKRNNPALLLFIVICVNTAGAQQTNLNEDYSAYLPEVRAFNKQLSQMPATPSVLTKEGLAAARKSTFFITPIVLKPVIKTIKGPGGDLQLRIFKPDTIRAVVMDIHGGGWSLGTAASMDPMNDIMARTCKVAVVSVDYRLAPEYPFPACIEDCKAAAKWLVNNSRKEFGTDKLFISGGSAGAHLSALTTLYVRDSLHAIDHVKGVNLIYGCFDLGRTPSCRKSTDSTIILSRKYMDETFQLVFHGWTADQLQQPQYSPLYADLKNLPPALFTVGTADPLIDDSYFMEARWRLAGNKTFLAVYPECTHAFNFFPTKMAAIANRRMYDWISQLCN